MSPLCLTSPVTASGQERYTSPNTTPTLLEFILPTPDLSSDLWPNLVWSVATSGRALGVINQERCFTLRIQVRLREQRRKSERERTAKLKDLCSR